MIVSKYFFIYSLGLQPGRVNNQFRAGGKVLQAKLCILISVNVSTTFGQPGRSGHPDAQRTGQKSGAEIVREGNEGNKRRMKDDRCNEEGEVEIWRQRGRK